MVYIKSVIKLPLFLPHFAQVLCHGLICAAPGKPLNNLLLYSSSEFMCKIGYEVHETVNTEWAWASTDFKVALTSSD